MEAIKDFDNKKHENEIEESESSISSFGSLILEEDGGEHLTPE
jgi:hypothetical protein